MVKTHISAIFQPFFTMFHIFSPPRHCALLDLRRLSAASCWPQPPWRRCGAPWAARPCRPPQASCARWKESGRRPGTPCPSWERLVRSVMWILDINIYIIIIIYIYTYIASIIVGILERISYNICVLYCFVHSNIYIYVYIYMIICTYITRSA